MKLLLVLSLLSFFSLFAHAADTEHTICGETIDQLVPGSEASILSLRTEEQLGDLLDAISERLLGTPYVVGSSGEGNTDGYDTDPLWRLDALDCTTFLETVLAASGAHDRKSFEDRLAAIRYEDGKIGFTTRNHFAEADWIANNVKAGFVTDITRNLFPESARTVSAIIDKPNWYAKMSAGDIEPKDRDLAERERLAAELRAKSGEFSRKAVTLPYLPMQEFYEEKGAPGTALSPNVNVLRKIPNGTIFNVVREGWVPGGTSPLLISHQGFVIQKRDGTYIRHAAQGKEVKEDRIDEYFARFLDSSTIRGINLLRAQTP